MTALNHSLTPHFALNRDRSLFVLPWRYSANKPCDDPYVAESGERTIRIIEAQYIVLNWPMWYVLAWDHLRNSERIFRLDRIEWAKPLTEDFKLRPKARFTNLYAPGFQTI